MQENPEFLMYKDSHGVPLIKDHLFDDYRANYLNIAFSDTSLTFNQNDLWFHLIQISDAEVFNINDVIGRIINKYPYLAEVKDANGRTAVNVATTSNARVINSIILIHGRCRLAQSNIFKRMYAYLLLFVAMVQHYIISLVFL